MLWTIAAAYLVIWLLGLISAHTMGGYIHVVLAIAIIVSLVRICSRRRAPWAQLRCKGR